MLNHQYTQKLIDAAECRAPERMCAIFNEILERFEPRRAHAIVQDALIHFKHGSGDYRWFHAQSETHFGDGLRLKLTRHMVEALEKNGFVFGRDYAFMSGTVIATFKTHEWLSTSLPPESRLLAKWLVWELVDGPYQDLEQKLGVPFFANLRRLVEQRMPKLTAGQQAHYLNTICTEVTLRTGNDLASIIKDWVRYPAAPAEPTQTWIYDLIFAAGGWNEVENKPDGTFRITDQGKRLLGLVAESYKE